MSTMSECCITFPGPVSRTTLIHIAVEYMKHVLYCRGQIPLPLDQLKNTLSNNIEVSLDGSRNVNVNGYDIYCDSPDRSNNVAVSKSNAVVNRKKQKIIETISKFDKFFKDLSQILETENVKEIVLNLGPNMMNPKELYRITLPAVCPNPECTFDYASFAKCKLQFFRKIMHSDLWKDLKSDNVLPISVLLLLENGTALNDYMEQKCFYALPRNCKQRIVRFMDHCSHASNLSSNLENFEKLTVADASAQNKIKTSGLWVKLKPDLRGFTLCSEVN